MLELYEKAMKIGAPLLKPYLKLRALRGKEDPERVRERQGETTVPRPEGRLLWCHAASIGESISLLPLIKRVKAQNKNLTILVTTGTVTSAQILQQRLGNQVIHQYIPLDVPAWVGRFLDHWKPDAGILVESELWPNLLIEAGKRNIPLALVNARLSKSSFANWQKTPESIRKILRNFAIVLTQSPSDTQRFLDLGAKQAATVGNLKFCVEPLPYDQDKLAELKGWIGNRPVWLLASSHAGEEIMALRVHQALQHDYPNLLTVIVPRHVKRAGAIATLLQNNQVNLARRSLQEAIQPSTQIYLADTMGEMGVFYRAIPAACIGGSLVPKGGHNLIEPAQAGCALLFGPYMTSSPSVKALFESQKAAVMVEDEEALETQIRTLFANPEEMQKRMKAARAVVQQNQTVAEEVLYYLRPLFTKAGIISDESAPVLVSDAA